MGVGGAADTGVIHKKLAALKHIAKGIENYLKIEAESSRLC